MTSSGGSGVSEWASPPAPSFGPPQHPSWASSTTTVSSVGAACRAKALSVWARVADWTRCSCRERAWWHLRHLQEPVQGRSEEDIVVHHYIAQTSGSTSPGRGRKQRKRRRGGMPSYPSASSLSTNTPADMVDISTVSPGSPPAHTGVPHAGDDDDARVVYLSPATQVYFVYNSYRVAFCLRMSRSLLSFQGDVLPIELLEEALVKSLTALCAEVGHRASGTQLWISIIACDAEHDHLATLVQGYMLNRSTLQGLVKTIPDALTSVENGMAWRCSGDHAPQQHDGIHDGQSVMHERDAMAGMAHGSHRHARTTRAQHSKQRQMTCSLERVFEMGMFALQFLPRHAAPAMVVLTDGVYNLSKETGGMADHDDICMRLSRHDIPVTLVSICPFWNPTTALGYLSDMEAVKVLMECTGGALLTMQDVDVGVDDLAAGKTTSLTESSVRQLLAHRHVGLQNALQVSVLVRHSRLNSLSCVTDPYSSVDVTSGASCLRPPTALNGDVATAWEPQSGFAPVARDKLKMYTLPLIKLKKLAEIRAAEGFQVVALRIGGSGRTPVAKASTTHRRRAKGISEANVLMRMCRSVHRSLFVEYTLEYCPRLTADDFDVFGSVSVTIDVVGNAELVRMLKDSHDRGADELRQSLRRFLRGVTEVDFGLFRVLGVLKPKHLAGGKDGSEGVGGANQPPTLSEVIRRGSQHYTHPHHHKHRQDEGPRIRDLMWLAQSSVHEWERWMKMDHVEVLTHATAEGHLEGAFSSSDEFPSHHSSELLRVGEEAILALLTKWCTHQPTREGLFWKVVQKDAGGHPCSSTEKTEGLGFALIRVLWSSPFVARIVLGFFGLTSTAIREQVWELKQFVVKELRASPELSRQLSLLDVPMTHQLVLPQDEAPQRGLDDSTTSSQCSGSLSHYRIGEAGAFLRSYLRRQRWTWDLGDYMNLALIAGILARSRLAAGYMLVYAGSTVTCLARYVKLWVFEEKPKWVKHVLIQYRVAMHGRHGIATELWMEPQYGMAQVHGGPSRDSEGASTTSVPSWLTHAELWCTLTKQCHEEDRRLLSTLKSFHYIRRLCSHKRGKSHSSTSSVATASSDRKEPAPPDDFHLAELLRGAEHRCLHLRLFSQRMGADKESQQQGDADRSDWSNQCLHRLTRRTLKATLGAEICSLDASNAVSSSRDGQLGEICEDLSFEALQKATCYAHRLSSQLLSVWVLSSLTQDAPSDSAHVIPRPELRLYVFVVSFQHLLSRLVGPSPDGSGTRSGGGGVNADSIDSLRNYITYTHRRNFTQVAYMALRKGVDVVQDDLRDALSYCSEIGLDVDLTQLRKMACASADPKLTGSLLLEPLSDMEAPSALSRATDQEFQKALSQYLKPVPGTDFYFFSGSEQDLEDAGPFDDLETSGIDLVMLFSEAGEQAPPSPARLYVRRASEVTPGISLSAEEQGEPLSPEPVGEMAHRAHTESDLGLVTTELGPTVRASSVPRVQKEFSDASSDSEVSHLPPCFVRFEVSHIKHHGLQKGLPTQPHVVAITATSPPSSVVTTCLDDGVKEESPWLPPQQSRQATVLSVVCATHSRLDARAQFALDSHSGHEKPDTVVGQDAKDLMLSTNKRFLRLIRKQIEAWAAAETLRCLLALSPLPEPAIDVAQQCMQSLPPEAVTRFSVNLAFVAELPSEFTQRSSTTGAGQPNASSPRGGVTETHEARVLRMFREQLISCRFLPVKQVSDVYVVVETVYSSSVHASPVPFVSPASDTADSLPSPRFATEHRFEEDYRLPYWAILSIDLKEPALAQLLDEPGQTVAATPVIRRSSLDDDDLLTEGCVSSYEVSVTLHHPPSAEWYPSRQGVMEKIKSGILTTCTHVNQLLLLNYLHDSRQASTLLTAPTDSDLRYTDQMEGRKAPGGIEQRQPALSIDHSPVLKTAGPEGHRREILPFHPDQFACPCQLTLRFPVFHRMSRSSAIRALESSVLHPLTVTNRLHMFVHKDRYQRVSYLRFDTTKSRKHRDPHGGHPSAGSPGELLPPPALAHMDRDPSMTDDYEGHNPASPLPSSISGYGPYATSMDTSSTSSAPSFVTAPHQQQQWVELFVHGVDEVGEEISVQLRRLLESRLAEFALGLLSELLSRNPQFQLTAADLDLIKMGGAGQRDGATNKMTAVLDLPHCLIRDPYLFLLYLRQNAARGIFLNNLHVVPQMQGQGPRNMAAFSSSPGALMQREAPATIRPVATGSSHASRSSTTRLLSPDVGDIEAEVDVPPRPRTAPLPETVPIPSAMEVCDQYAGVPWSHPAIVSYTGPLALVEDLKNNAEVSHPVFWAAAHVNVDPGQDMKGKVVVDVAAGLLDLYFNNSEMYELRKDFVSTLSARGSKLAKEAGKGLALLRLRPLDSYEDVVRRLWSAVPVSFQEVTSICTVLQATSDRVEAEGTTVTSTIRCIKAGGLMDSQSLVLSSQDRPRLVTDATGPMEVTSLAVEIVGLVNKQPLVDLIKLCVDQSIHDYLTERLLAFIKQGGQQALVAPVSVHTSVPTRLTRLRIEEDPWSLSTSAGLGPSAAPPPLSRLGLTSAPLSILLTNAVGLDSPSVRRLDGQELLPASDFLLLTLSLARGLAQLHPQFQGTLTMLRRSRKVNTGLQSLSFDSPQQQPVLAAGDECWLMCGLRVAGLDQPTLVTAISDLARGGSGGKGRPVLLPVVSDDLQISDVLYPHLTMAEGATADMLNLRVTGREALCWVRLTDETQSMTMYNFHPELAGRCTAVFQRALAMAALERFVAEGLQLQRFGFLTKEEPWWSNVPGLSALLEGADAPQVQQVDNLGPDLPELRTRSRTQSSVGESETSRLGDFAMGEDGAIESAAAAGGRGRSGSAKPADAPSVPLTPAMAARLRASGRAVPPSAKAPQRRKLLPPTLGAPSAAGPGTLRSDFSSTSSVSEASMIAVTSDSLLQAPLQWMTTLLSASGAASSPAAQAVRRLSSMLCDLQKLQGPPASEEFGSVMESIRARDWRRLHVSRIARLLVRQQTEVASQARIAARCSPWTWRQHVLLLQQRERALQHRLRRPLPELMTTPASVASPKPVREPPIDQALVTRAMRTPLFHTDKPEPLSRDDIQLLQRRCRWHGSWSLPLLQRSHIANLVPILSLASLTTACSSPISRPPSRPLTADHMTHSSGPHAPTPFDATGVNVAQVPSPLPTRRSMSVPPTADLMMLKVDLPQVLTKRSESAAGVAVGGAGGATTRDVPANLTAPRVRSAASLMGGYVEMRGMETDSTQMRSADFADVMRVHRSASMFRFGESLLVQQMEPAEVALAQDFLDHCVERMEATLDMAAVPVARSESQETWPLKAYVRRYLSLTRTVMLLELVCDKRKPSARRTFESEIVVTASLLTLDVSSDAAGLPAAIVDGAALGGSSASKQSAKASQKEQIESLPTSHTFAWTRAAGQRSVKPGANGRIARGMQLCPKLPVELWRVAHGLMLHTKIYDFLVDQALFILAASGVEPDRAAGLMGARQAPASGSAALISGRGVLGLVRELLQRYPEPPSQAQSAIRLSYLCQPVHDHYTNHTELEQDVSQAEAEAYGGHESAEAQHEDPDRSVTSEDEAGRIPTPERGALLAYIQSHAERYGLWPLKDDHADLGSGSLRGGHEIGGAGIGGMSSLGVVGSLDLNTGELARPSGIASRTIAVNPESDDVSSGRATKEPALVFLLTLADDGSYFPGFTVYVLCSKGRCSARSTNIPSGGRLSSSSEQDYRAMTTHVEHLLSHVLESASFDFERERIWTRIERRLRHVAQEPRVPDFAMSGTVGGLQLPDGTAASSGGRGGEVFSMFDLDCLVCFSVCTPLETVDRSLAELLHPDLGVPWHDVLAHLQQTFMRQVVAVAGHKLLHDADLLISVGNDPPAVDLPLLAEEGWRCGVLLHMSVRGDGRDMSMQLIQRNIGVDHKAASQEGAEVASRSTSRLGLSEAERARVGVCINHILSWIWTHCLKCE